MGVCDIDGSSESPDDLDYILLKEDDIDGYKDKLQTFHSPHSL